MYLNKKQLKGLKSYKSSSTDSSPISTLISKPLWLLLSKYVIKTDKFNVNNISPNTLSAIGFICTISQYAILAVYDPTFNAQSSARIRAIEYKEKLAEVGLADGRILADPSFLDANPKYDSSDGLPGQKIPAAIWFLVALLQFLSYFTSIWVRKLIATSEVSAALSTSHNHSNHASHQAAASPSASPSSAAVSPCSLSEMLSHTTSAWSCSFNTMAIFSVIGSNEMYSRGVTMVDMFLMTWCLQFLFYSAHWEKLATGTLAYPWSFDFTSFSLLIFYVGSGIFGSDFWTDRLLGTDITLLISFRLFVYIATSLNLVKDAFRVFCYCKESKALRPVMELFLSWVSMLLATGLLALWVFAGPYTRSITLYHPRMILLGVGAVFANILNRLLIYQMAGTPPSPIINPGIFTIAILFVLDKFVIHHAYLTTIIWPISSILLILMQFHYLYICSNKLASLNNSYIFKNSKRSTSSKYQILKSPEQDMESSSYPGHQSINDNISDDDNSEIEFKIGGLGGQGGGDSHVV